MPTHLRLRVMRTPSTSVAWRTGTRRPGSSDACHPECGSPRSGQMRDLVERHRGHACHEYLTGDPSLPLGMTTMTTRATTRRSADTYDRDYFDKWYRNPRFRVKTPRELARQATFVVSAAEHILGRTIRTV